MIAEIEWNFLSLAVVAGCAIPVIAIVATAWQSIEKTRATTELKRDMIRRGMSVEEIERVLAAKQSRGE